MDRYGTCPDPVENLLAVAALVVKVGGRLTDVNAGQLRGSLRWSCWTRPGPARPRLPGSPSSSRRCIASSYCARSRAAPRDEGTTWGCGGVIDDVVSPSLVGSASSTPRCRPVAQQGRPAVTASRLPRLVRISGSGRRGRTGVDLVRHRPQPGQGCHRRRRVDLRGHGRRPGRGRLRVHQRSAASRACTEPTQAVANLRTTVSPGN